MLASFCQARRHQGAPQLDEFADFQVLALALANGFTALALEAAVKTERHGII